MPSSSNHASIDDGDIKWIVEPKGHIWEGTDKKDAAVEYWRSQVSPFEIALRRLPRRDRRARCQRVDNVNVGRTYCNVTCGISRDTYGNVAPGVEGPPIRPRALGSGRTLRARRWALAGALREVPGEIGRHHLAS
jgi:hypothetical protein